MEAFEKIICVLVCVLVITNIIICALLGKLYSKQKSIEIDVHDLKEEFVVEVLDPYDENEPVIHGEADVDE